MIRDVITLIVGNYFLTLLIIGLNAGWLSLDNKPKSRSMNVIAEPVFPRAESKILILMDC